MSDQHPKPSCNQIIDMLPDPFVVIDKNYRIVAANQLYCKQYGVETDQVVGRCCYQVSHHSEVPCSQHGEHCPLEEVFRTHQPTQVMHVHYDYQGKEEHVQLSANPITGEDGENRFWLEIDDDVQIRIARAAIQGRASVDDADDADDGDTELESADSADSD